MHALRNRKTLTAVFVIGLAVFATAFIPQEGYHGGRHNRLPAANTDLSQFVTDDFDGSGLCAICHAGLTDQGGNDVSNDAHWRSTMMANAAKDPYWQAKVSAEVEENPALADVIEDKCSTCHMPMAHTQALVDGAATGILGNSGFLSTKNKLHEAAMDGVSCALCHQIDPDNLGSEESFSGHYAVDTATTAPNRLIYGPYTNPAPMPMINMGGYTPAFGQHVDSPELCATCHTLFTPTVDAKGNVVGELPEQTAYIEWQNSRYKRKNTVCQDCHMPVADGAVVLSRLGPKRNRQPFFQHYFVGGNVFMQRVLRDNVDDLGLTADEEHFEDTITRTLDQLQKRTAKIRIKSAQVSGDTLTVTVVVKNKAGHKFPTGFPSRRAWIELTVTGEDDDVVFSSGAADDDGVITGNDNDADPEQFEQHYDLITEPGQVQIYESIMENSDGEVTQTLLRGAAYVKDNRLMPKGMKAAKAPQEIAPAGEATADGNFKGGADTVTYRIDLGGASGPFTVSAKLHYQAIARPFIDHFDTVKTTEAKRFRKLMKKADHTPVLVASATKTAK